MEYQCFRYYLKWEGLFTLKCISQTYAALYCIADANTSCSKAYPNINKEHLKLPSNGYWVLDNKQSKMTYQKS